MKVDAGRNLEAAQRLKSAASLPFDPNRKAPDMVQDQTNGTGHERSESS